MPPNNNLFLFNPVHEDFVNGKSSRFPRLRVYAELGTWIFIGLSFVGMAGWLITRLQAGTIYITTGLCIMWSIVAALLIGAGMSARFMYHHYRHLDDLRQIEHGLGQFVEGEVIESWVWHRRYSGIRIYNLHIIYQFRSPHTGQLLIKKEYCERSYVEAPPTWTKLNIWYYNDQKFRLL